MQYKRSPLKFVCGGIDLNHPVDLMPPGKYPYLKNVQAYQDGRIETRAPITKINSSATTDHTILGSFRMNDYVVSQFTRFLKISTKIYFGSTSFSVADASGWNPDIPFCAVAWRPDKSPEVWAYLADNFRMRKFKIDGTNYAVGVVPPTIIPTAEIGVPLYGVESSFTSATNWHNQGDAGAVSLVARLTSVTVGAIKYTTGTTGWAAVAPAGGNLGDITAGMRIIFDAAGSPETAVVEEVHKVFDSGSNTVNTIIYDVGTTGLCTIMPTQSLAGIKRNALIRLNATEYVRVISVTNAPGGLSSFRCITVGTIAAGNAIQPPLVGSFWVYLTATHAAAETLTAHALQTTVTKSSGVGAVDINPGAPGDNFGFIGTRPTTPDDYIHLGIKIDDPAKITEIRLVFDVDRNTTNSYNANDGKQNAYYISFRGNDLQNVLTNSLTSDAARQAALQQSLLNQTALPFSTNQPATVPFGTGQASTPINQSSDTPTANPNPTTVAPAGQLTLGQSQWTEFKWRMGAFTRAGSGLSMDWSDVRAIQLQITLTSTVVVQFADLWVGGTYGPDTSLALAPLIYRYRYRSSATGAKSLPGPAMRSGIHTERQVVLVGATVSTDPQVDKIDFERMGAQNLTWNYVGTVPNSGTPVYVDDNMSAAIVAVDGLETDAFQPFPLSDVPKSSTVTVAGTAILKTAGDAFDTSWARGTEVYIGGKLTTLYASPTSATLFHVADAMVSGTGITLSIPEPIKAGQPLQFMWGPFFGCNFAAGNILDVGSVYYTKPNDPDSAPPTNRVEVTSPSEAIVNGCVYDGRSYCWSDKRLFSIVPSFTSPGTFQFVPVPNAKGLWAPHALAVGPRMWYLASDGIYESDGGQSICISDDIKLLFQQYDVPGFSVNGMKPVQMAVSGASTAIAKLRLTYHNGMLLFDYVDCASVPHTLAYDIRLKGWFPYTYFEDTSEKVIFHASEQGFVDSDAEMNLIVGSDAGFLYTSGANGSGAETIHCEVDVPATDVGDSRAKKIYGDVVFDFDCQGVDVVCTPWINNYLTALTPKTYATTSRQITDPLDLSLGVGQFARNLGMKITWSLAT